MSRTRAEGAVGCGTGRRGDPRRPRVEAMGNPESVVVICSNVAPAPWPRAFAGVAGPWAGRARCTLLECGSTAAQPAAAPTHCAEPGP